MWRHICHWWFRTWPWQQFCSGGPWTKSCHDFLAPKHLAEKLVLIHRETITTTSLTLTTLLDLSNTTHNSRQIMQLIK